MLKPLKTEQKVPISALFSPEISEEKNHVRESKSNKIILNSIFVMKCEPANNKKTFNINSEIYVSKNH